MASRGGRAAHQMERLLSRVALVCRVVQNAGNGLPVSLTVMVGAGPPSTIFGCWQRRSRRWWAFADHDAGKDPCHDPRKINDTDC